MSDSIKNPLCGQTVFIVSCYQTIIGVYSSFEDAFNVARTLIQKGRISDVSCQIIK